MAKAVARWAVIIATLSTSPWVAPCAVAVAQQCEAAQYLHPVGLREYFVGENIGAAGDSGGGIGTMWHAAKPTKPKPGVLPRRRFLLYVPKFYGTADGARALPLWFLFPGAWNEPEKQMNMSEMVMYAEKYQFAFAAMKGDNNLMNVVLHSKSVKTRPDDVKYTKEVLARVRQEVCIDSNRIYCSGYSRGARFCSRLASKMSDTFAGISPVSGLRYPDPNEATRPMPILTFHGKADPINPYEGDGNPEYWKDSVQDAVGKWAKFNKCTRLERQTLTEKVFVERHTDCDKDADVVLVVIVDGGHVWPGSRFDWAQGLGHVTYDINASVMMQNFFKHHPLVSAVGAINTEEDKRGCDEYGTSYQPLGMLDHLSSKEQDAAACQARCQAIDGCEHFSYYESLEDCYLVGMGGYRSPGSIGFVSGPAHCLSFLGLAAKEIGGDVDLKTSSLSWAARYGLPSLVAFLVSAVVVGAVKTRVRNARDRGRSLMVTMNSLDDEASDDCVTI